jgi:putative endonuclease
MATNTQAQLGRRGEQAARRFVRRLGWDLLARNWRHETLGEIDLVALCGTTIVFAEVKTRRFNSASVPEDAMREEKRRHLRSLARAFKNKYDLNQLAHRFDVLAITVPSWPWPCRIRHYESAFV